MRAMPKSVTLMLPSRVTSRLLGLDVAMDYALGVRIGKRVQQLADDVAHPVQLGLQPLAQIGGERLARHVLHGDEAIVALLAVLVDLHDVGVRETRGRLRFALEPAQRLCLGLRIELGLLDQLDRQSPVQHRVPAFQHGGHAALTEDAAYLVPCRCVVGIFIGLRDEPGSGCSCGGERLRLDRFDRQKHRERGALSDLRLAPRCARRAPARSCRRWTGPVPCPGRHPWW